MAPDDSRIFTGEETWHGGSYELAIELGPGSDSRLEVALKALWNSPDLEGCYTRRDQEPVEQTPVEPSLFLMEGGARFYGVARLPTGGHIACQSTVVREEDGPDWLVLSLPMGALSTLYDVGAYPFDDGKDSRQWREPLDNWLVVIARSVFAVSPFALALIGHEVSGRDYADNVSARGLPQERWDGYLWRDENNALTFLCATIG